MGEIRGEKVSFRRQDIVPLHRLPSAQAEDPLIVHCPPRLGLGRRLLRYGLVTCLFFLLSVSAVMLTVEGGGFDRILAARAQAALNTALAPDFIARIETTQVRFFTGMHLSVEARGVTVHKRDGGGVFGQAESVRLVIDPLALGFGRVEIDEIDGEGLVIDANQLPAGPPIDLAKLRVDQLPALLERAFVEIDNASTFIARGSLDRVSLHNLQILRGNPETGRIVAALDDLTLERVDETSLVIEGSVAVAGKATTLKIDSQGLPGRTLSMNARLESVDLAPFLIRRSRAGEIRQGLDADATIAMEARRADDGQSPVLSAQVTGQDGLFYMDGKVQPLTMADINLAYDFSKDTIELRSSRAVFGATVLPFTGALIDLDRLDGDYPTGSGIGIDLLVRQGTASVPKAAAAPVPFDFKVYGRYLYATSELQADQLIVSTPAGTMTASARVRNTGAQSPEVRFSGNVADMKTEVVKQLWPFWIADKPRDWIMQNVIGGTVARGTIDVFIPAGRMSVEPTPLHLRGDELKLDIDLVDSRVNVTGKIPPVRDASAHITMNGEALAIDFKTGASYFSSGRTVKLDAGRLTVDDVYLKPLMADLDLDLSGKADAVGELVTYEPINVLSRTGLKPEDLSGDVKAKVRLRVGLIRDQNPPPTEWNAHLDLSKVSLATEIAGRKVAAFDGTLDVDRAAARLKGGGEIDGVPMELTLVEPVEASSTVARERIVKATLSNAERDRLVPGLEEIIDGPLSLTMTRIDESRQKLDLDLARATLRVPWVGWSKGQGVAAKASFEVTEADGLTRIKGLELTGDGFGASGDLVVGKDGLQSAEFRKVRLSPADDFAVVMTSAKGGYDIRVTGGSADIRSLMAQLKSSAGSGAATGSKRLALTVGLDSVEGFGGEELRNVSLSYLASGGKTSSLDLTAVTERGEAVVAKMTPGESRTLTLTSSDAGAVLRIANLYTRMAGGLLNLKLNEQTNGWSGTVDVRNFQLVNEQRLQSIVSTPAGRDGQSLNNAVRRDIDVSSERFQRAFARLVTTAGAFRVENGVVRGEQVGATFQGVVRDESGRMDLTGTFMPAYGLNRIFGELPIIGAILGNGRDRGLLGITFRLSGPTEEPRLAVNPLSIIAPGVFRQIFEFR
ncbi:hypothetical protein J5J10_06590 [Ciceribacter sp. L1K23]|uniref:YhdP family protein n=1 Tax=Ciceribacter sp. L1K23 TaxID=2820276 RepID=UPI001B841649|nr:DUF3971 domain-containing protein [Ciceribacter sp. L1K23]MBR0555344.1 hypothetical protein [Ciceribacter sp. L1K23]